MFMGDYRSREPACQMFAVGSPLAVTVGGECLASSSGPSSLLVLLVASSSLVLLGEVVNRDPKDARSGTSAYVPLALAVDGAHERATDTHLALCVERAWDGRAWRSYKSCATSHKVPPGRYGVRLGTASSLAGGPGKLEVS